MLHYTYYCIDQYYLALPKLPVDWWGRGKVLSLTYLWLLCQVHSIDSALLSAEEQDLVDTDDTDTHSSYQQHRRQQLRGAAAVSHNVAYRGGDSDVVDSRRMTSARRVNAVSAARRMAESRMDAASMERRHVTGSTIHRNVSAFGEITVMPVGDNENDNLRIAVGEEIL